MKQTAVNRCVIFLNILKLWFLRSCDQGHFLQKDHFVFGSYPHNTL
jgi:hypothetical protein